MIPYGQQSITSEDIDAVVDVLKSDFLTQGPQVPAFESCLTALTGADHAVAVNSATSALHIACLALEVGRGDLVWTTPITFVASANCALYCGAEIDFVDIDPHTYNMSVPALAEKLERARDEGRLPKLVIPVHLTGQSCQMAEIADLSRRYGFRVIEDASHAIGASYRGAAVGSCRYSDVTIFSFHPVKIITTAEGGAALTNDPVLARRMELLRSHGITRDETEMTGLAEGPWYYEQVALGYNYRMTDLQAALGVSQLERLSKSIDRRHAIASQYDGAFASAPIITPWQHPETRSAYHLYVMQLENGHPLKRDVAFERLRRAGIGVNVHYIPVHLQPFYRNLGFSIGQFPVAEEYYARAISLPMFPTMTEVQVQAVIAVVTGLE
jgi:UDP-4-amino-4,6-dideoxy-N-acetyl-beta-L-altrosamine transaminase